MLRCRVLNAYRVDDPIVVVAPIVAASLLNSSFKLIRTELLMLHVEEIID